MLEFNIGWGESIWFNLLKFSRFNLLFLKLHGYFQIIGFNNLCKIKEIRLLVDFIILCYINFQNFTILQVFFN